MRSALALCNPLPWRCMMDHLHSCFFRHYNFYRIVIDRLPNLKKEKGGKTGHSLAITSPQKLIGSSFVLKIKHREVFAQREFMCSVRLLVYIIHPSVFIGQTGHRVSRWRHHTVKPTTKEPTFIRKIDGEKYTIKHFDH